MYLALMSLSLSLAMLSRPHSWFSSRLLPHDCKIFAPGLGGNINTWQVVRLMQQSSFILSIPDKTAVQLPKQKTRLFNTLFMCKSSARSPWTCRESMQRESVFFLLAGVV